MATFYIESGTGRQVTDLNTIDPTKSYVESGTGKTLAGASLKPSTVAPTTIPPVTTTPTTTAPLPGVVYQPGTETPGGGGTSPDVKLYGGTPVPSTATSTPNGLQVPEAPKPAQAPQAVPQPTTQQAPQQVQIAPPQMVLQPGSADAANVGKLQDYLVSLGLMQPQDLLNGGRGIYGPKTTAAVAQLQSALGVDNSSGVGYFGPKTISALLSKGTSSTTPQTTSAQSTTGTTTPTAPQQTETGMSPSQSVQEIYTKMYSDSGLGDIKSRYEQTLKDQQDLQNELNDKIIDIKNDPWKSQGVVDKETKVLKEKYEARLETYSNFAKLYQSIYEDGLEEIRFRAGLAEHDIQRAFESAQKKQEALDKLAGQDIHEVKANGRVMLVDYKTGKVLADLGADKSGTGGVTSNAQIDNERSLLTQFVGQQIVKDYNTILGKKKSVDIIINQGVGGPGDLALVYEFMKALDPTSVVRETEYATAAKSGNIFLGSLAKFNGYLKEEGGFLPPNVQTSFQSIMNSKLQVQQELYDNTVKQYQEIASRQGLNPANVTIDFGAANTQQEERFTPGSIVIDDELHLQYLIGPDGVTKIPIGSALPLQ